MSILDYPSLDEIVRSLDLAPHPEGGFYRETFRDPLRQDGRAVSTAIYYLLPAGQTSAWHRVDAAEVWHYYAGAPLMLSIREGATRQSLKLGNSFAEGQWPQAIVPANSWQSARSLGEWTLVGCTVAPGFEFSRFELAAEGRFEAEDSG
ncbi:MAG: cupin domain-containing protein [Alphaproteobacteria bacterium]|nr:cupin domain-containing protein [Alphaproteobacteria bacterium]